MQVTGVLKNWAVGVEWSGYTAPELRSMHLTGAVYDRAGFDDGAVVVTSALKKVERVDGVVYGHTANSIYRLEDVDPTYEKMFPNVVERLIESSAKVNAE